VFGSAGATNLCGLGGKEFEGEGGLPFSPRLGQLLGDVHGGGEGKEEEEEEEEEEEGKKRGRERKEEGRGRGADGTASIVAEHRQISKGRGVYG
jgi:hypothetical protein